jgi:hypothetical protein
MSSTAERATALRAAASSIMLYRERRDDVPDQQQMLLEAQTTALYVIALALHELLPIQREIARRR